jgi:glutamate-1-semialdehyde 2,1-aminomutase
MDLASTLTTKNSAALAERLQQLLPGGDTRSAGYYPPYPIAMARGEGCRLYDLDGNVYVDFLSNYTSLIHGNAHPAIADAIAAQARRGTAFTAATPMLGDLAERIVARVESIERLRFVNSGTEAVMTAVRAARAFTGRTHIVKAVRAYHGSWDQVVDPSHARGYDANRDDVGSFDRASVAPQVRAMQLTVEYNDAEGLRALMRSRGGEVAALIFEPVLGQTMQPGEAEFLRVARELADEHGALLILDEVITFRLAPGARQAELGVRPDLTTLGKAIGGGLPVGAVGGRADVLDVFDPRRRGAVTHTGTFSGNPMSMVAGIVSLDLLTPQEITRINALGSRLTERMRGFMAESGVPGSVEGVGSLIGVSFHGPQRADALQRFHRLALEEGIFIAPRGLVCVSTAMDDEVVEAGGDALGRVFEQLADRA